ncbi:MAG: DUF2334 domain-containing protein [Verrucomicrobia bacterium]|nr:DUF2334 domain-containing protein [Verrucomicrobiota bacterium]
MEEALLILGLYVAFALMPIRISAGEIFVVLRFDDYGGDVVTEFDQKLIQACETHGIPVTIGVVPFMSKGDVENPATTGEIPLGEKKVNLLTNLVRRGKVEIAQHGYSHRTRNAHYTSEFDGLPVGEQVEKIAKGKKYLEDAFKVPITTFIPPWNRYDTNTIVALQTLGFKSLSGGTRSPALASAGLKVLPSTCELGELKRVIQYAQNRPERDNIVVAIFHAYDFVEVDAARGKLDYSDLEEIFEWLARLPDVKTRTISEMTSAADYLSMRTFANHRRNWFVCRLLPPFLVAPENHLYREDAATKKIYGWNLIKAAGWYLLIGAGVTTGGRLTARLCLSTRPLRGVITKRTFMFLCTSLVLLTMLYGCRHLNGSYREFTIGVVGLGVLLSIWTLPDSVFGRSGTAKPRSC